MSLASLVRHVFDPKNTGGVFLTAFVYKDMRHKNTHTPQFIEISG
jgi:hypothetical protein